MRIIHVTLRFDAPGGVETTVREVARRQRAAGHDARVFASDLIDESRWIRGTEWRPAVDGVPVTRFPVRREVLPGLSLPTMVGLGDALTECGPDLIHAHSHRYGHVLQAAAAAHRGRVPLVVSTHYHPADAWEPAWKKAFLRLEDFAFGASAYQIARSLVVESELERRLVGEFSPRDRLRVVPPGIDATEWEGPAPKPPPMLDLPQDYLLFVGRIAANKGLPTLFEALARLPEAERPALVLMGPPWGENPALEAQARTLGLDGQIRWLGQVADRTAYRATLRGARALVLPSAWEAFGLVLLEAMAARVPIVATAVGAVPEVLDQGRTGRLVPYGDAAALAGALRSVRAEPEVTARMVDAGAARAHAFDWATSVERLDEVYRRLAP